MNNRISRLTFAWLKSYTRRWWRVFLYNILPKMFNKKPKAEVYLALNDPYSFMLVQTLPDLAKRFDIEFDLFLVHENTNVQCDFNSWRQWLWDDANLLAKRYQLTAVTEKPSIRSLHTGQQLWQLQPRTIENANKLFQDVWFNRFESYYGASTPVINHQIKNQEKQARRGHYQSGSIFFAGEWYVGVERLDHLEHRLVRLQLLKENASIEYQYTRYHLSLNKQVVNQGNNSKVLNVYVSIRSPYSYLGWEQAKQLSACYNIKLQVKIVLPLMMRGVDVSADKLRYMMFDALREARVKKIPVGKYADPLGQGIINSYTLFPYAEQQNKTIKYIDALFQAVFVQGIDLSLPTNLITLCKNIGLDYVEAFAYAEENDWQQQTDVNQSELNQLGFWGVPCFTYNNTACWGQDKLWQIEEAIIKESR